MSDSYSSLKIFHHRERIDQLKRGEQTVPAQVQVVLSDLCNQSCSFCAYRMDGYTTNEMFHVLQADGSKDHNPNRMIPTPKALEILDDCKAMGVGAIQFTGGGEPTVHPDHVAIFRHALDVGMDAALVTNGTIWRPGIVEVLSRFKWVRFSIDAGNRDDYASIRKTRPETFDLVHDHIVELSSYCRRNGDGPLIGVGFVVTRDNWRGVLDACARAKEVGANSFRISAVFQQDGPDYFDRFYSTAFELCRRAEGMSSPSFRVDNMLGERVADLEQGHPDYSFCGYQQLVSYIGGDQNAYRCCNLAYNPRGLIGSIKDQRFRDLWESDRKREDFSGFDASGCPRCQFNGKNKVIAYAINESPSHVNFV